MARLKIPPQKDAPFGLRSGGRLRGAFVWAASLAEITASERQRNNDSRAPLSLRRALPRPSLRALVGPGQVLPRGAFCAGLNLSGPLRVCWVSKEAIMDKEHVKGAADKAKGAVKDAAGKMMDDKKLQAEGKMDKAKGEARQALGDAKDAARAVSGRVELVSVTNALKM